MILVALTLLVWLVAELWLQIPQVLRDRGVAKNTEWATLAIIVGSIWVGTALAVATDQYVPQAALPIPAIAFGAGLAIAWAGIILRLVSMHTLGRFFRFVVQIQEAHEVVQSGPYRVIRHPAYAGLLLAMVGFGVTHDNVASFVVLVGCSLVGVLYRIRVEERVLRSELGPGYADYADRTPRLIPGLW